MFQFDGDLLGNLGTEKLSKLHMVDLNEFKNEVQKRYEKAYRNSWHVRYHAKQPGRMNITEAVEYAGYLARIDDCEWIAENLGFELKIPETTELDTVQLIRDVFKKTYGGYNEELEYYRKNKDSVSYMLSPAYRIDYERKIARIEGAMSVYDAIIETLDAFLKKGK